VNIKKVSHIYVTVLIQEPLPGSNSVAATAPLPPVTYRLWSLVQIVEIRSLFWNQQM